MAYNNVPPKLCGWRHAVGQMQGLQLTSSGIRLCISLTSAAWLASHTLGCHMGSTSLQVTGLTAPHPLLHCMNACASQMCKLPQDRDLVPKAREAAAKFLAAESGAADPASWPAELMSLVFSKGRPQLDITDISAG